MAIEGQAELRRVDRLVGVVGDLHAQAVAGAEDGCLVARLVQQAHAGDLDLPRAPAPEAAGIVFNIQLLADALEKVIAVLGQDVLGRPDLADAAAVEPDDVAAQVADCLLYTSRCV